MFSYRLTTLDVIKDKMRNMTKTKDKRIKYFYR